MPDMIQSEVAAIIEAVILQQLHSFREELTNSDQKLIAHQCAMEAARRIYAPTDEQK